MSALVTDQFRILNASNFIQSIGSTTSSYYVWVGLTNPRAYTGFGRHENWSDGSGAVDAFVPNPIDNFTFGSHYKDTLLFGKKISSSNVRRAIRRIDWQKGTKYDMYRHDYSIDNPSAISKSSRLYDSNYYVINTDYRVYICISNGSSGINTLGNQSQFEPTFTDLEPSQAGTGEDGYLWKYLFTVAPSDLVKFDSTDYITLPNDWDNFDVNNTVRDNGDSRENNNQIKYIYIEKPGIGYTSGITRILGDGSSGEVSIEVDDSGSIINATITSGGQGYTYGIVDLGVLQKQGNINLGNPAKLIPIIPPSYGHGFDLYKELGADRVLIYTRFDDSTRDFPIDTKFCQVGIIKDPSRSTSDEIFVAPQFSGLYAVKVILQSQDIVPKIGEKIVQSTTGAVGYVASFDTDTLVLKYFKDRSLYYSSGTHDQTDYIGISTRADANVEFSTTGNITGQESGFVASVNSGFSGITTTVNNRIYNLGVYIQNGLASPEINKKTGEIIYVDNRPLITRNIRQKEDIKIILEF